MRHLILAILSIAMISVSCGGGDDGPGDAVLAMFDALKAGNGATVVSYMSTGALEELGTQLDMLKADPETAASQLALMGVRIDAADIPDMTTAEFADAVFSSDMISGIMSTAEVTIGEVVVDGESAMVEVTTSIMDETETHTIEVVREDGFWKVTELGMSL